MAFQGFVEQSLETQAIQIVGCDPNDDEEVMTSSNLITGTY
jgi:hypothetical protein